MFRNSFATFFTRRPQVSARSPQPFRPWLETLEDRCVPTTTAVFNNGLLSITGDAGANSITVTEQATPGAYQVAAPDLANSPLLFAKVKNIKINTLDGTDAVIFNGDAATNTFLPGALTIAGTGALTININNNVNVVGAVNVFHAGVAGNLNLTADGNATRFGSVTVTDGDANATITVKNSVIVKGFVSLKLGGGSNAVQIVNGVANTGFLTQTGGAANDTLIVSNSSVGQKVVADLGADTNQVFISGGSVGGNIFVATAGNNETIALQLGAIVKGAFTVRKTSDTGNINVNVDSDSSVRGALAMSSGAGSENMRIDGNIGGNVSADLGAGNGTIRITGASIIAGSLFHAGTGALEFDLGLDSSVAGAIVLNKNNAATATLDVFINEAHAGALTANGGQNDGDAIFINNSSIGGNVNVNLGAGNNETLQISSSTVLGRAFVACAGTLDLKLLNAVVQGFVSVNPAKSPTAIVTANLDTSAITQFLAVFGGQDTDQVTLTASVVYGKTILNLGAGADIVNTDNTTFTDVTSFLLGAGADAVNLQTASGFTTRFAKAFTLDGGTEDDIVTLGTGTGRAIFNGPTTFLGGSGANGGLNTVVQNVSGGFVGSASPPNLVNFLFAPAQIFAFTGNSLFTFDARTPGTIANPGGAGGNTPVAIANLVGAAGETVVGIDFRPFDKTLVALTHDDANVGRLYLLNISAANFAKAALLATVSAPLVGTAFDMDFDPTNDHLRVVSNTGQNLSVNPINGFAAVNANLNPNNLAVVGAAYTNNFHGAPTTKLFHIAAGNDTLRIQNPAGSGKLFGIGALGVDTDTDVGFDIGFGNSAYASLTVAGASAFYVIDLTTGIATLVGDIGGATIVGGIAVKLT